jgi:hypothetical protein
MMATACKVFDDTARAGGDAARAKLFMTSMDAAGVPLDRFLFSTVIDAPFFGWPHRSMHHHVFFSATYFVPCLVRALLGARLLLVSVTCLRYCLRGSYGNDDKTCHTVT